jgi:hypothetical protein
MFQAGINIFSYVKNPKTPIVNGRPANNILGKRFFIIAGIPGLAGGLRMMAESYI